MGNLDLVPVEPVDACAFPSDKGLLDTLRGVHFAGDTCPVWLAVSQPFGLTGASPLATLASGSIVFFENPENLFVIVHRNPRYRWRNPDSQLDIDTAVLRWRFVVAADAKASIPE